MEWDADAAQCRLEWRERGGPTVGAPLRKGFGASLMQAAFSGGRGAAAVAYEPDGVRCSATFPIAAPAGRG